MALSKEELLHIVKLAHIKIDMNIIYTYIRMANL